MERRPIFIIRLPKRTTEGEFMIAKESLDRYPELGEDYHILIIAGRHNRDTEFECYGHNLTDIEVEELKLKIQHYL